MELQMDQKNLYAGEFLDQLIGSIEAEDQAGKYKEAVEILRKWNQVDSADAAAPLIFHKLINELPDTMFSDEMPKDVYRLMPGKSQIIDEMLRKSYRANPVRG